MPILLIQNEVGTLCIVPVVGNPEFYMVIVDFNDDPREYPSWLIPVEALDALKEQYRAKG